MTKSRRDMHGHYGRSLDNDALVSWALLQVQPLKQELNKWALSGHELMVPHPVFIFQGMSGVAHATAMATAWNTIHREIGCSSVYVRKPEEESHGQPVEYYFSDFDTARHRGVLCFVDDMIDTGYTLSRTIDGFRSLLDEVSKRYYRDADYIEHFQAIWKRIDQFEGLKILGVGISHCYWNSI